jgi:hypothetical protein
MPLANLCIHAATTYWNYLNQNNKGVIEHQVSEKHDMGDGVWTLHLAKGLRNSDEVRIRVGGQLQETSLYKTIEYDPDTKMLMLKVLAAWPAFTNAQPASIALISDMKFLVSRVEQWFHQFGNLLQFPARGIGLQPPGDFSITREQTAAVSTMLVQPLSFVWGPPGTGKTKKVLAAAVIAHVRAGNTVLVLAPTNNALDLAITGLIESCQIVDIALDRFIRLGTPGHAFASRFPDQCEVKGIQVAIEAELRRLRRLERHLNHLTLSAEVAEWHSIHSVLSNYANHLGAKLELERLIADDSNAISQLQAQSGQVVNRLLGGITGMNQTLQDRICRHQANLQARKGEWHQVNARYIDARRRIGEYQLTTNIQIESALLQVTDDLFGATARVSRAHELLSAARARLEANPSDADLEMLGFAEVRSRKQRSLERIQELEAKTLEVRLGQVQVIGLTLDHYIGNWAGDRPPLAQIFLDEAAYTPLIKALTLFRGNVPVALLGDDFQLQPVCEVKELQMKKLPELLPCLFWARSALFIESALSNQDVPDDLLRLLGSHLQRPPAFGATAKRNVTVSYRYGPHLAELLSHLVYSRVGLTVAAANPHDDLIIQVVHAPRSNTQDWTCEAQAQAVSGGVASVL